MKCRGRRRGTDVGLATSGCVADSLAGLCRDRGASVFWRRVASNEREKQQN